MGGRMMQTIKYEINKNILTVGFNEAIFVVYADVPYDSSKTKQELLQQAYEQCRNAIEYEKTQEEPSILFKPIADEEYEEFVPEEPKATKIIADFNNLVGEVLDQYGEFYSNDIKFYIDDTNKAKIENNKIIEEKVEKDIEYFIVAEYGELREKAKDYICYTNS